MTGKEFDQLVYENQDIIRKVCDVYCNSESDKQDLFQDIVLKLWQGIASFRQQAQLSTWIYKIALNTAISQLRKNKRNIMIPTSSPPDTFTVAVSNDDQLQQTEQITCLYKAINQLKPSEKAIVLLYLEEKSYEEIAEITGLNLSNVSVKLVRIKKKLKQIFQSL
ncbi:MAG: sigma-70 family RNA polymerase sigma factor, partial [Calditrichaeota bacterium]